MTSTVAAVRRTNGRGDRKSMENFGFPTNLRRFLYDERRGALMIGHQGFGCSGLTLTSILEVTVTIQRRLRSTTGHRTFSYDFTNERWTFINDEGQGFDWVATPMLLDVAVRATVGQRWAFMATFETEYVAKRVGQPLACNEPSLKLFLQTDKAGSISRRLRAVNTTVMPLEANCLHSSNPIPLFAPVTTAYLEKKVENNGSELLLRALQLKIMCNVHGVNPKFIEAMENYLNIFVITKTELAGLGMAMERTLIKLRKPKLMFGVHPGHDHADPLFHKQAVKEICINIFKPAEEYGGHISTCSSLGFRI
ncbi:hypothetical protein F3Y22_tig00014370pilonHSYRG00118 [Hibiscus syriacus]|uniref:Uncharacterized protein n=1 Tax=Hibiscus syriacus TaxID=106335 RepID=A0A6A3BZK7_HIBSY|nr:hypothetical protein F3Y22_tig00014370pilonHSYRG00118 [Hibiscus syriacus]